MLATENDMILIDTLVVNQTSESYTFERVMPQSGQDAPISAGDYSFQYNKNDSLKFGGVTGPEIMTRIIFDDTCQYGYTVE
jgi:hypothetical protein